MNFTKPQEEKKVTYPPAKIIIVFKIKLSLFLAYCGEFLNIYKSNLNKVKISWIHNQNSLLWIFSCIELKKFSINFQNTHRSYYLWWFIRCFLNIPLAYFCPLVRYLRQSEERWVLLYCYYLKQLMLNILKILPAV